MAQVEPMDIDAIENDFDNKENAFQYNNVLSRTPCTEKGYEELDVSELNMKLRYSITPASSPMTKSLTGPCLDNRNCNAEDFLNSAAGAENGNLTRSLNSTLTKTEGLSKSKALPLQTLSSDPFVDSNRNSSIRRLLDPTDNDVIISVHNANDVDENLSLPSPCSSVPDTPEATTPTKEIPKPEGSPILRGLKSVLSMFRPSQSPILPADDKLSKLDMLSPVEPNKSEVETVQVSTPVSENKQRDANSSKRNSPLKDSLVFNDNIERELLWKDETTILFKDERIPVHKLLFLQNPITTISTVPKTLNTTVENMDISCDESFIVDKTNTNTEVNNIKNENAVIGESLEFLDCETTFTKNESSEAGCNKLENNNEVQETGNVTFDLANDAEKLGANIEYETIMKTLDCITPGNPTTSTVEVPVSITDVSPILDGNHAKIIEATINLLHSECNYYSKTGIIQNESLENKSQVNKELQLESPNVTLSAHEEVITNHDVINPNESRHFEALSIKNDIAIANNIQDSLEKKEPEHIIYVPNIPIDIPPDVCIKTLNNFDNPKNKNCETLHVREEEEIDVVDDMAVTINNKDIVRESPASDTKSIDIDRVDVIGDMPNIDSPNMFKILASTQDVEKPSSINLSINNEDKRDTKNIEMLLNNDTFTDIVHDSKNIESVLSDHSIIKDTVTQTNKNEGNVSVQPNNGILLDKKDFDFKDSITDFKNVASILDDSHKPIDDMPQAKNEDDITMSISNLSSLKNLISPTDSLTIQSDMNDIINSTIVSSESKYPEINIVNSSIDIVMKDNLETKIQSFSLGIDSESNVECETDGIISVCDVVTNTNSVVDNALDNDREVPELIIGSDTFVSKSPLEIPLPEDDDIDQNILSICNTQDTATKVCGGDSIMNFENDVFVEQAKALNHTQEIDGRSVIDVINNDITEIPHDGVIVHKEENEIQTCISLHMSEVDAGNNMEQKEDISGLQIAGNHILSEENISKDISVLKEIYEDVGQDTSKMNISENPEDTIVEEKILSNTEKIKSKIEIVLVNNEHYGEVKKDENSELVNKEKIDDGKQNDFTVEKGVDAIDEEIITSANNSPYVSVTDLDKIVENIPNETLDEIDNPVAINTTFGCSPPLSPKIVSKGYNFNFDEIDDPFATKTKIRMSPSPETPNQSVSDVTKEVKTPQEVPKKVNRRKSQPERKKPVPKKNVNTTFNNKLPSKDSGKHISSAVNYQTDNISTLLVQNNNNSEDKPETTIEVTEADTLQGPPPQGDTRNSIILSTEQMQTPVLKEEIHSNDEDIKPLGQTLVISTEKSTSSSEQYFSLGTSSGESSSVMNKSKNVFNLPEIDDMNFNPFATKSKVRMSPPPTENPTSSLESINEVSKSFVVAQEQPNNIVVNKNSDITFDRNTNDSLPNTSNTTFSSKATNEIDSTVREILTEDEDTVEGPFLELDSLRDSQKVIEVEVETDMLNFEEISSQERDENMDNGELFIDADAFEFLLNQNKSTTVVDSGKESLFLKFDPLFANRVTTDGILATLSKVQKRQSTPKKLTKPTQKEYSAVEKSAAGPSNKNENCGPVEEYNEDLSSTVTKPMMVVNPAVSSITTQKKAATPKLNRRSLTFTSPAMAVIDRLLSLSGNSSHLENETSIPQVGREHSETDLAITQLRELLAEKEINVHTLRTESKELKDRLAALEVQVRSLETESADRLSKIKELNERLQDKTKMNKSMAIVVEEYERTIASLIAETEHDKKRNAEERMRLIKERDEQTAHLTSMEVSFSDLHSKYEKSKQIILSCKANEDIYKKTIKEFQDNFSKMQNNYELLKQHATSKLNHANQELEKMNRAHEAEVLKMNAMIKRKELHITSLEETLAQKTKANEELTAICDELINKVG